MRKIEKLVRDNIPIIIANSQKKCRVRILTNTEYTVCLKKKLKEELDEFTESDSLEELADILEVVEAIVLNKGSSWNALMDIKKDKAQIKGTFKQKVYLVEIDD